MSSQNLSENEIFIIDSFALIAYLEGEAGGARVSEILKGAQSGAISIALTLINLGEILYIVERERGLTAAQDVLAASLQLPVQILEVDRFLVFSAAHVKANYRLSYSDAFVVAAAQALDGVILTGDPEFKAVEDLVRVEWLPVSFP